VGFYLTNYLIGQRPFLKRPKAFILTKHARIICGISSDFSGLSPTSGQVTFVLLSRSPLLSNRNQRAVRLACIRHAASVHPELGSNPPILPSTIQLLRCPKDKIIHRRESRCFLIIVQSPPLCQDRDLTTSATMTMMWYAHKIPSQNLEETGSRTWLGRAHSEIAVPCHERCRHTARDRLKKSRIPAG
jgi:hypothetical protein